MIAIKSMKNIPKSCIECELLKHGGYCYYKKPPYELSSYDILDERPSDCPLVEIVTCKDCKYRDPEDKFCDCGHTIKWSSPREDNFFCADGRKKA